jgi:hypothetical protein
MSFTFPAVDGRARPSRGLARTLFKERGLESPAVASHPLRETAGRLPSALIRNYRAIVLAGDHRCHVGYISSYQLLDGIGLQETNACAAVIPTDNRGVSARHEPDKQG